MGERYTHNARLNVCIINKMALKSLYFIIRKYIKTFTNPLPLDKCTLDELEKGLECLEMAYLVKEKKFAFSSSKVKIEARMGVNPGKSATPLTGTSPADGYYLRCS